MQPIPILHAKVTPGGTLDWLASETVHRDAYLRRLAGQRVDIIIRTHRQQRTLRQNRYFWGVVIPLIAEHCGYEKDEMHELLAMRFLRIADDPVTGSPRRTRTPDTNTAEFSVYVESCIRFAATELGVDVPLPEEVAW